MFEIILDLFCRTKTLFYSFWAEVGRANRRPIVWNDIVPSFFIIVDLLIVFRMNFKTVKVRWLVVELQSYSTLGLMLQCNGNCNQGRTLANCQVVLNVTDKQVDLDEFVATINHLNFS